VETHKRAPWIELSNLKELTPGVAKAFLNYEGVVFLDAVKQPTKYQGYPILGQCSCDVSLPSIHKYAKNVWSAEDIQWLNYKDVEVPTPRSDDELVEKLAKKGITVAQRTVIKNRKAMNIPIEEKPLRDSHLLDEQIDQQIDQQSWQKLSEIAEQWRGEDGLSRNIPFDN
jgi:hypothetical protein